MISSSVLVSVHGHRRRKRPAAEARISHLECRTVEVRRLTTSKSWHRRRRIHHTLRPGPHVSTTPVPDLRATHNWDLRILGSHDDALRAKLSKLQHMYAV